MKTITMKFGTILITSLLIFGCVFTGDGNEKHKGKDKNKKKGKKTETVKLKDMPSPQITVVKRWDLPKELLEISGLVWLGNDRFACVQDEAGSIYFYNTRTNSIERKLDFAGPGDFEGLTMVGKAAYIVRSDGKLYEVSDINVDTPVVKEYNTPLTAKQNIEGLCYDSKSNRLLLAVKDQEPNDADYKGIYEFNISTKKLRPSPVYKIPLDDELSVVQRGKKERIIRPSAIGKHPNSNEFYILDGPNAGLLLMDSRGRLTARYSLGSDFFKPEGITFTPEGRIFISNEGKKDPANITEIRLSK